MKLLAELHTYEFDDACITYRKGDTVLYESGPGVDVYISLAEDARKYRYNVEDTDINPFDAMERITALRATGKRERA
jgi:hypothetical protein